MSQRLFRHSLAAALLAVFALPAAAQEFGACRAHVQEQWQELGRGALDACLKAVEQMVEQYNVQGFKFGALGQTLLASDANYFYQSADRGQSWSVIGLKADLKERLAQAPLLGKPLPGAVAGPVPDLRNCSLFADGAWRSSGAVTLEACSTQLDASPDQFDSVGYKYGYWGKLFLAADKDQILRSDNSSNWTPIRPRSRQP